MNYAEQIEKVHQELIEQEGLKISELPEDIKKKIKGWDLLFSRLSKNPEDEKLYRSLQKTSIQLADKIQDFIESDYEEDDSNGDDDSNSASDDSKKPASKKDGEGSDDDSDDSKKPASKKDGEGSDDDSDDSKKPASKKDDEGSEPSTKNQKPLGFGNLVMEKKIKQQIAENGTGRIRLSQLRDIVGKEPDYPEQKVHSLNLRKVFMSSEYRIV